MKFTATNTLFVGHKISFMTILIKYLNTSFKKKFQSKTTIFYSRNSQTKYIQSTVSNVEKHFGDLCSLFAACTRKTARLRDKSDLLVKAVREYADTETPHLKYGLSSFADHFALIQDYRHAEVSI